MEQRMEHYSVDGRTFVIVGGQHLANRSPAMLTTITTSNSPSGKVKVSAVGDAQRKRREGGAVPNVWLAGQPEEGGQVQTGSQPPTNTSDDRNGSSPTTTSGQTSRPKISPRTSTNGKPPLPPHHSQKAATAQSSILPVPSRAKIIDARHHFFTTGSGEQQSPSPPPPSLTSPSTLDSDTIDGFRQRAQEGRERAARSMHELVELERACRSEQLRREEERLRERQRHLEANSDCDVVSSATQASMEETGSSSSGSNESADSSSSEDDDIESPAAPKNGENKAINENRNDNRDENARGTFLKAPDVVYLSSSGSEAEEENTQLHGELKLGNASQQSNWKSPYNNNKSANPSVISTTHTDSASGGRNGFAGTANPALPFVTSTPQKLYTNRASLLEAAALAGRASTDYPVVPDNSLIGSHSRNSGDSDFERRNYNNNRTEDEESIDDHTQSENCSSDNSDHSSVVAKDAQFRTTTNGNVEVNKNNNNLNGNSDKPFRRSDADRQTLPAHSTTSGSVGGGTHVGSLTGSTLSVNGFYLETDVDTFHSREVIRVPENQLQEDEQQQRYYRLRNRSGRDTDDDDDEQWDDDNQDDGADVKERPSPIYSFGFGGGSVKRYRPHKLKTQSCFNLTAAEAHNMATSSNGNGHPFSTDNDDNDGAPSPAPTTECPSSARLHSTTSATVHAYDDRASLRKSAEFLLRDENKVAALPPENQLRATAMDRAPSEHELRIRRSLQKLDLPDWYKNSPLMNQMGSTDGFILRRDSAGSAGRQTPRWEDVRSRCSQSASNILGSVGRLSCTTPTSFGGSTTGSGRQSRNVVIAQRVTTPDWRHVKSSRESLLQSPASSSPYSQYYQMSTKSSVTGSRLSTPSSPRSSSPNGSLSTTPSYRSIHYPRQPYLGWRSSERLASDGHLGLQQGGGNFYRTPPERMSHGPGYYTLRYGSWNRSPASVDVDNGHVETANVSSPLQVDVPIPNGSSDPTLGHRMEVAELVREIDKLINRNGHMVQENGGSGAPDTSSESPVQTRPQVSSPSQLQPSQLEALAKMSPKSAARQKVVWMESSFVGVRPPPGTATSPSPPGQPERPPRRNAPSSTGLQPRSPVFGSPLPELTIYNSSTTSNHYNQESEQQQRRPSSTTLEEVLDSLLALPPHTENSGVVDHWNEGNTCVYGGPQPATYYFQSPLQSVVESTLEHEADSSSHRSSESSVSELAAGGSIHETADDKTEVEPQITGPHLASATESESSRRSSVSDEEGADASAAGPDDQFHNSSSSSSESESDSDSCSTVSSTSSIAVVLPPIETTKQESMITDIISDVNTKEFSDDGMDVSTVNPSGNKIMQPMNMVVVTTSSPAHLATDYSRLPSDAYPAPNDTSRPTRVVASKIGANGTTITRDSYSSPPDSAQLNELGRLQDDEAYCSLIGVRERIEGSNNREISNIESYVSSHGIQLKQIDSTDEVDDSRWEVDCEDASDVHQMTETIDVQQYDRPYDSGIGCSGFDVEVPLRISNIDQTKVSNDVDLDDVGSQTSFLSPVPQLSSPPPSVAVTADTNLEYDRNSTTSTTFTSFAYYPSFSPERRSDVETRLSSSDYYSSVAGSVIGDETTDIRRSGRRGGKHARQDLLLDDTVIVKCSHEQCRHTAELRDARILFKTCHNCYSFYCSRGCRKDHQVRHRRVCMYGRISSMCKQALQSVRYTPSTHLSLSGLARNGFLTQGRGFVKLFFRNTDLALSFLRHGWNQLEDGPVYVTWRDLAPQETGDEVYRVVVDLCQRYDPETKFVLLAGVYITREAPLKSVPHWEREMVAKCARLPLHTKAPHPANNSDLPQSTTTLPSSSGGDEVDSLRE